MPESRPFLVVIGGSDETRDALAGALRSEFDGEFEVRAEADPDGAVDLLERMRAGGARVALVLAVESGNDTGQARTVLARASTLFPGARRILATDTADTAEGELVDVDSVLYRPASAVEECLYPAVRELLDAAGAEREAPGESAVRVIGNRWSREAHEIRDFLARNHVPYTWIDVESDPEAGRVLQAAGLDRRRLPALVFSDGEVLERPGAEAVAERIGLVVEASRSFYDLVIVGAGPAGLAAAVYGSSEGLKTLVIERDVPGGQAGLSSRIENYLGFPRGLTGSDLSRRAVEQAESFGSEILVAAEVKELRSEGDTRVLILDDGSSVRARTVLLAMGVAWRGLDLPGCHAITGAGIYYGAASAEAPHYEGQDVYLLGGGNSGGQAALHLQRYASSVTMLVPEADISERMSSYLVERVRSAPNIHVRTGCTVCGVHGTERLEGISVETLETGEVERIETGGLFVFIGGDPQTDWLEGAVERDEQGYLLCGAMLRDRKPEAWPLAREPLLLESSMPGVFVAGDVRAGSVKRIGSAVGEGSVAIQLVHEYLGK